MIVNLQVQDYYAPCRSEPCGFGGINYYEYLGCLRFEKQPPGNSRNAKQYEMDPSFEGATDCRHSLKVKQTTPLLVGAVPPHPGDCPIEPKPHQFKKKSRFLKRHSIWSLQRRAWRQKADRFARYHLILFRPESIHDNHSYTWEDLRHWTTLLAQDDSIISKFRLMTIDNHIKNLRTSGAVKK